MLPLGFNLNYGLLQGACLLGWLFYSPIRLLRQNTFSPKDIRKVLVVAYNHGLGNMILLTPMLSTLKRNLPDVKLTVLVGSDLNMQLVEDLPYVDRVLVFDKNVQQSLWNGIRFFVSRIGSLEFDLVISTFLESSFTNSLLTFLSGSRYRVGYTPWPAGFLNTFSCSYEEQTHEAQRSLDILRFLGLDTKGARLDLSGLEKREGLFATEFYRYHGVRPDDIVIGFHPGSGPVLVKKRWPLDRFIEVALELQKRPKVRTIFFVGPDDEKLFDRLKRQKYNFLLVNRQPIKRTASIMGRCNIFVSSDTGLMHMAAALDIPTVAIFGPTIPTKSRPWNDTHILVRKNLECSPCYVYGKQVSCEGVNCLKQISSEEVLQAIDSLLESPIVGHSKQRM